MEFLLEQVTYLKVEDVQINPVIEKLIEQATYYTEDDIYDADLETMKRIFQFKDNDPYLYILYLNMKKNISKEERCFYLDLIDELKRKEKIKIDYYLEKLKNE